MSDTASLGKAEAALYQGYCCPMKHYYMQSKNLIETLQITPRVIIYKKRLRTTDSYLQTLKIKNIGLFPRRLRYFTDSPSDTTFFVDRNVMGRDIAPDNTLILSVKIEPVERKSIDRLRHIYIEVEHPNCVIEIPIIVLQNSNISWPSVIKFPPSVRRTKTFYELVIYNPTSEILAVKLKCPKLTIKQSESNIHAKDYMRVLLMYDIKESTSFFGHINLKIGKYPFNLIQYTIEPKPDTLFLGVSHIDFNITKYKKKSEKDFIVCNESSETVNFTMKFLTDEYETINTFRSKSNDLIENDMGSFKSDVQIRISTRVSSREHQQNDNDQYDSKAFQQFAIKPMMNSLNSNVSTKFTVVFQPEIEYTENGIEADPPYFLKTKIFFTIVNELFSETKSLIVTGPIDGLEAIVSPGHFDLRKIYLGEEHCENVNVINKEDNLEESIYFMDYSAPHVASCTVTPQNGLHLKPGENANFTITIFALLPGKFNLRLRFKVKSGIAYFVIVRGTAANPQVRHFPDILEFGTIPVAVPQKRYILIMNPLSVPMTLQCCTIEDGTEPPLTFNIFNVDGLLPLTVKNPIKQIEEMDDEYDSNDTPPIIFTDREVKKESSFHSISEVDTASFSTKFEEEVLVHIEDFAYQTLWDIRRRRFLEKAEAEKKVMQVTMEHLKSCPYFDDMNMNNYKFMDWNALPNDPQEIYVDEEIVHLNPNTGKKLTVVIVPNKVGYFSRAIQVRCCPINLFQSDENTEKTFIDTDLMSTKIWFEYNCRVPDLQWEEIINFHNQTIYAGCEYEFIMTFINLSGIGGFVYYDVVPDCDAGEMFFTENQWKYYCEPEFDTFAECAVIFKKWGEVTLSGIIRVVGLQKRFPFHVVAFVLPQKVSVTPKNVYHRIKVLEKLRFYLWIENVTTTSTWISLSFKSVPLDIVLDTKGAIMSPDGQGVCITALVKFYDPDNYKNSIYINLHYGDRIEVPINLLVEGMPLIFTPNIKEGVDAGVILSNTEQNFNDDRPKYFKEIKVKNYGRRTYRLTLNKLKSGETTCAALRAKVKVAVTPKFLVLESGQTDVFQITINAFEETEIYNEFRIHIVEVTNIQRFLNFCFVIRAKFVLPELTWTKREMTMAYRRTHKFNDHLQMVTAELNNIVDCDIENVQLKAIGPIRIKLFHEHKFEKEICVAFNALEKKDIIVVLNRSAVKDKCCAKVEGRVQCTANGKIMRSFVLHIKTLMPKIKIMQPEMIIFNKQIESFAIVEIENIGCLDAQFKWKKQGEQRNFVGEYDDVFSFAHEVLSDLLRMIELDDDDETEEEENLTLRYQKYRCKLRKAEQHDPLGIRNIIMELIDSLDLEHKRYKMSLGDSNSMICWDLVVQNKIEQEKQDIVNNEPVSYQECAEKTVQHIIANLNIEDSYDISDASSDDCEKERTFYFFEKQGVLKKNEKCQCLLHLPKVKKGYALQAVFELVVVGGCQEFFTVILVNLEKTVDILRNNIYLGMKPWYEQYSSDFKILNVTQFPINIRLGIKPRPDKKKRHRLSDGYVEICDNKVFSMTPITKKTIKLTGIMGFSEEFIREIRIVINNDEELSVRLRGQGIMPIFSLISKDLKRIEQDPIDIILEYALLQRIYQFDVFKSITEYDDDLMGGAEEENHTESIAESSTITMISASSDSTGRTERKFFKLLKTYVLVNNNAELPNAIVLDQLLETEKFLERLTYNEDSRTVLQMVYNAHVKEKTNSESKLPLNLKHFTIQPLPFELHGYLLHMGELKMNHYYTFEIELHFFGPGKLTAAARTEVKVPGLSVDFDIKDALDRRSEEYVFYNSFNESNLCVKPYRNMYERILDQENDPFLKHAHSYDVDKRYRHQRERTLAERACIKSYYNSLNKSVYEEHKHHFVHCKVYSKSKKNYSGTIVRVIILIKPEANFYEDGQLIEEHLYIDLHMGPTLPILLRAIVNKK